MHRLVPEGSVEDSACFGELESLAVQMDKRTVSNSFYVVVHTGSLNFFPGRKHGCSPTLAHSTHQAAAGRNKSLWCGPDVATGLVLLTA